MKTVGKKGMATKAISLTLAFSLIAGIMPTTSYRVSAKSYPTTTYEAERAKLYNVTTNTNHIGYSGSGFVDGFGETGDYVQFSITIPSNEDVTLRFKYSNYCGTTNIRQIYVDNTFISNAYFTDTGSWDTWNTTDVGTSLTAGTHTVKISVDNSSDGYINLDNLIVTEKHESVRSLYLSNWRDSMAIWKASKASNNDTSSSNGPCLTELRYSSNWSVNQIKDYSAFFRDETNNTKYDQIHNFDSEGYFDESGVLHNNYLTYSGSSLPGMEISRDYVFVPNHDFIVTRYTLTNTGSKSLTYSILDMIHPNNTSSNNVSEYYDSNRKAIFIDMSNAGQPCMALGAFTTPTYYQVANDADSNTSSSTCSPFYTFDNNGRLNNNANVTASDVSAGFEQKVTIPAGSSQYVYFYLAIGSSLKDVQSFCDTARAQTGDYWFTYTASRYSDWFSGKKIPTFDDTDLTTIYKRNLVMIKNCIRPGESTSDGAMPATTNPAYYSYKVWSRDSAVTAIALDAAGFTTEAERYWNWLAARQSSDGTFHTCYNLWTNDNSNFVEPEHDAVGLFLIGVYKHYEATGDKTFLNNIYEAVKASADFIMYNINQSTGFGPADKSIWEEGDYSEYYTYTQATYAMGLKCAALIALADSYNGAGSTIETAINRDDTDATKGLWNVRNGYYNRCANTDGTVNQTEDTSTNILFVFGVIDVDSSRASKHVAKLENDLSHDTYGLPRYAGDTFYYTSPWSPSGNESMEQYPSWPQMTMWDCIYHVYKGDKTTAYNELDWFKHRTGAGFMVTGECVNNITEEIIPSTACEPVTAGAYILAALVYTGNTDTRIYASENNAGCYKSITVSTSPRNDWGQYQYVPYYVDESSDSTVSDSQTDIKKVYICNDANNIYIRVNNVAGSLPSSSTRSFRITAYTEDFSGKSSTTTNSINGTALGRNMAFMFTKSNTDSTYSKYTASNGRWTLNKSITSVISPQWDTTTGGFEMVIPRSEIGSPADNSWGHINIILEKYSNGSYVDSDMLKINYRLTSSNESWIYGNFE